MCPDQLHEMWHRTTFSRVSDCHMQPLMRDLMSFSCATAQSQNFRLQPPFAVAQLFQALLQDAELAISLLYQLGEGAAEETLKPGSGALGQLATGSLLPSHTHHLLSCDIVLSSLSFCCLPSIIRCKVLFYSGTVFSCCR